MQTPSSIATKSFSDASAAVARLEEIYERNTKFLRDRFEAYVSGEAITTRVRAYYPFVRLTTATHARLDTHDTANSKPALAPATRGATRFSDPFYKTLAFTLC